MRPRLRMTKGRAVNGVIAVALLIVGVMIAYTVRGSEAEQSVAGETATVDTGMVTSTVSASGNVESTASSNVNFEGAGGIVTKIKVKEGDTVRRGQVLAVVDQTAARLALDSAKASLDAARASYATTVQAQSAAERAVDSKSIASAQASVDSAQVSLSSARQSRCPGPAAAECCGTSRRGRPRPGPRRSR